ncbi:hypothetical protein [Streptomyces sp. NPDC001833]|uniref:hypothetical protein n=1 Tax=Streptomyces sp. NPDC001833 TaxID=3154658 RepID=UPI003320EEE8
MLSYLAAALPLGIGPAARLLALQCALRMSEDAQVRVPAGLLRGAGLGRNPGPWRELEQTWWLRRVPVGPEPVRGVVVARLLDHTLLTQSPARPDRRRAADWALRAAQPARASACEPLLQLAAVWLAASTASEAGEGLAEADRMAHDCGIAASALANVLGQLTAAGLLEAWSVCPNSGDLCWTPAGVGNG